LDVSKNTELIRLYCGENHLTDLDVSKNTSIEYLDCRENEFSASALNALFETLHSNKIKGRKTVTIYGNSGTGTCNKSIAEDKNWRVNVNENYY
jgi:hypothetical protein